MNPPLLIHRLRVWLWLCLGLGLAAARCASGAASGSAPDPFRITRAPATGWLTGLRRAGDVDGVEFLRTNGVLGSIRGRVRTAGGPWTTLGPAEVDPGGTGVRAIWTSGFRLVDGALRWEIVVRNAGQEALEVGELGIPLPMNTEYVWDHEETFVRRVIRHAWIAGHGSFLYWLPVRGSGPFLVLLPVDGTSLEYFTAEGMDYAFGREQFTAYAHAAAVAEIDPRGTWRQPLTSRRIAPGDEARYTFEFVWADSYAGVRTRLRRRGGLDIQVAPGLVIPRDLEANLALGTTERRVDLEPEHPADTRIREVRPASRSAADRIYRLKFSRLGENRITVRYGDGRVAPLEFFVTEPLEVLIRKRAAFITAKQQHRAPTKWYDGLYSLWDRRQPDGANLLGPDHLAGQHPYAVSGSDDPSNGKCLLVAEKNVAFPDATEIAALEYFVERFVWGKQQRTDRETPYPFGIYGSDSWRENRFTDRDPVAGGVSRPGGPSGCRMWRTFDYPTYFALYYDLYRIARQRPDLVRYATATDYLDRAFGTAKAYFEVPANLRMEGGWSFNGWVYWQYTVGNFHEKYLLPLVAALEAEGRHDQARWLRGEWEKKVKYFIYDNPWPFASEMPIDSTAYESTYVAARYALEHGLQPDANLWHDRNQDRWFSHPTIDRRQHEAFLVRQHLANLACRGVLEPHYWSLGSDFRGCGSASYTLSYMSTMGGAAVLDHALRFAPDPAADLRLGYASMLSSWALLNSGDAASNYGYWTPGPTHDGAMSWGFQPRRIGTEWNPATRDLPRGAWPVCGEADHGLVAAIESARTIVFDDPLFGLLAYGGEIRPAHGRIGVIPRDGVRQRLSFVLGPARLHLELDRDGFAAGEPVVVSRHLDRIRFGLENRGGSAHASELRVEGAAPGAFEVTVGAGRATTVPIEKGTVTRIPIALPDAAGVVVEVRRRR